jgi:hypothetical protein
LVDWNARKLKTSHETSRMSQTVLLWRGDCRVRNGNFPWTSLPFFSSTHWK